MRLKRAVLRSCASSALLPSFLRVRTLTAAGAKIFEKVLISSGSRFAHPENLVVGRGTYIAGRCTFEGDGRIALGANCFVATDVVFLTSELEMIGNSSQASRSIEIGDGTWISAETVIHPGVKIGPGCSIDKGSVITKSFGRSLRIGGNPAVEIKPLEVPLIVTVAKTG